MKKLGNLFMPWQYSEPGDDCIVSDSTIAYEFFKDEFGEGGDVLLAKYVLASLVLPFLPVWIYYKPKEDKIVAFQSVFKINDVENFDASTILKMEVFKKDVFFYWGDALYCSAVTSTGEVVIKRIRAILSEDDMLSVQHLAPEAQCEDIYPVKLYAMDDGRFLATCWAMELSNDSIVFEPVMSDDEKILDQISPDDVTYYPVSIGEKAIIGENWYELKYTQKFGKYFDRMPVKVTPLNRRFENLVLDRKPEPKPKVRPIMRVIKNEGKTQPSKNTVTFHPSEKAVKLNLSYLQT